MAASCRIFVIAGLLVLLAGSALALEPKALDMAKFCAAKICLESRKVTRTMVQKTFGGSPSMFRKEDGANEPSFCYYDAARGVSTEFTFSDAKNPLARYPLQGIMVTTASICPKNSLVKGKARVIGLGPVELGMAVKSVVEKMGEPARIDDAIQREKEDRRYADTRYSARFGDKVYVYDKKDDLGFVFVFLREDKVSTIWASTSE